MKKEISFKNLFWSYFFIQLPLALILSILSLIKVIPVTINDQEVYGIAGFVVCWLIVPFSSLLITFSNWIALEAGFWIWQQFRLLTIRKSGV